VVVHEPVTSAAIALPANSVMATTAQIINNFFIHPSQPFCGDFFMQKQITDIALSAHPAPFA
jgi:hypothetical protein